jgi:hypothetical protein
MRCAKAQPNVHGLGYAEPFKAGAAPDRMKPVRMLRNAKVLANVRLMDSGAKLAVIPTAPLVMCALNRDIVLRKMASVSSDRRTNAAF